MFTSIPPPLIIESGGIPMLVHHLPELPYLGKKRYTPYLVYWLYTIGSYKKNTHFPEICSRDYSKRFPLQWRIQGGGRIGRAPLFFRPIFVFLADFCYFRARHRGIWIPGPPPLFTDPGSASAPIPRKWVNLQIFFFFFHSIYLSK